MERLAEQNQHLKTCFFYFNKKEFLVTLEKDDSSSKKFKENPFLIRWNLCDVRTQGCEVDCSHEFLNDLKKSLVAHEYDGVRYLVPNTVVKFGF